MRSHDAPSPAYALGVRGNVPALVAAGSLENENAREFAAGLVMLEALRGRHLAVDLSGAVWLPDWIFAELERFAARLFVAGRELVCVMTREDAARARRRAFPSVVFSTFDEALVFIRRRAEASGPFGRGDAA